MDSVVLALLLLAVTCAASLVQPLLRVPLPLVQIALGAGAALLGLRVHFDPNTFLLLFIPPLLFADGWRMPRRELRALRWPLLGNAVGLVFVTVAIGGYGLHWLIPTLPLPVAFAIAAIVSPTDAVAFGAITERVTVPTRLRHMLESEALLNDASGLVAFRFAVAATLTGQFSLPHAALQFVLIAAGGLAIGWLVTFLYARLIRLLPMPGGEEPLHALLPALLPFAAYWLAEHAGVSGILAAVGSGMAANRAGLMERLHYTTRMQSGSMWRVVIYSFNGIVFVLLGTQLPSIVGPTPGGLDLTGGEAGLHALGQVAALTGLLIVVRLVWATLALLFERLTGQTKQFPHWRLVAAASVAGVRGAITLAGVLTLPLLAADGSAFPSRDIAITLATGVILFSLVIAALFLPLLLRNLPEAYVPRQDELRTARIAAAKAAVDAIEVMPDVADARRAAVLAAYRRRLDRLTATGDSAEAEDAWRDLHAAALRAERDAVRDLRDRDAINDETAREVVAELDLIEAAAMQRPLHQRPSPATSNE